MTVLITLKVLKKCLKKFSNTIEKIFKLRYHILVELSYIEKLALNERKKGGCTKLYTPKNEYYDLPTKYNETVVRLLVQSPTRMYVYWEVSDNTIKNFDNNKHVDYNICTPILKITNTTMGYSYEMKIDPFATSYYIDVKDANCNYKVELGRRTNNEFVSIYESNQVKIPRSVPVCDKDSEEIIYRNCIRMDAVDKFTIYRTRQNNIRNRQDYYGLSFSADDSVSSLSRYNNK